jgi:hypothetical protein
VAKFTNLTPSSLLISCKLSFSIDGLKMSSLPTLALKSPYIYIYMYIYSYIFKILRVINTFYTVYLYPLVVVFRVFWPAKTAFLTDKHSLVTTPLVMWNFSNFLIFYVLYLI